MLQADLADKNITYLGSIDDKVVQYQKITHPERQLQQTLFFSAILGDTLVLNDGYLLHTKWGRRQLMDEHSPLRQLNKHGHVLLLARSDQTYSEWIRKQSENTQSYRDLLERCSAEDLDRLDEAWSQCVGSPWPTLDVQQTMLQMLESSGRDLLGGEIPAVKLVEHERRFRDRVARKETIRSAWEAAMTDMKKIRFDRREKAILMEFANEAYHASFACGFAGGRKEAKVGIAGFGSRRLHRRGAYGKGEREVISEVFRSKEFQTAQATFEELAIVLVSEREIFNGARLVEFLRDTEDAKAAYRSGLQGLLHEDKPTNERVEAFEHALRRYGEELRGHFQARQNRRILWLIDFMRSIQQQVAEHHEQWELACKLIAVASPLLPSEAVNLATVGEYLEQGLEAVQEGVPVATNVYVALQRARTQPLSLLPKETGWLNENPKNAYELSLDGEFVRSSTDGIPMFRPPSRPPIIGSALPSR